MWMTCTSIRACLVIGSYSVSKSDVKDLHFKTCKSCNCIMTIKYAVCNGRSIKHGTWIILRISYGLFCHFTSGESSEVSGGKCSYFQEQKYSWWQCCITEEELMGKPFTLGVYNSSIYHWRGAEGKAFHTRSI